MGKGKSTTAAATQLPAVPAAGSVKRGKYGALYVEVERKGGKGGKRTQYLSTMSEANRRLYLEHGLPPATALTITDKRPFSRSSVTLQVRAFDGPGGGLVVTDVVSVHKNPFRSRAETHRVTPGTKSRTKVSHKSRKNMGSASREALVVAADEVFSSIMKGDAKSMRESLEVVWNNKKRIASSVGLAIVEEVSNFAKKGTGAALGAGLDLAQHAYDAASSAWQGDTAAARDSGLRALDSSISLGATLLCGVPVSVHLVGPDEVSRARAPSWQADDVQYLTERHASVALGVKSIVSAGIAAQTHTSTKTDKQGLAQEIVETMEFGANVQVGESLDVFAGPGYSTTKSVERNISDEGVVTEQSTARTSFSLNIRARVGEYEVSADIASLAPPIATATTTNTSQFRADGRPLEAPTTTQESDSSVRTDWAMQRSSESGKCETFLNPRTTETKVEYESGFFERDQSASWSTAQDGVYEENAIQRKDVGTYTDVRKRTSTRTNRITGSRAEKAAELPRGQCRKSHGTFTRQHQKSWEKQDSAKGRRLSAHTSGRSTEREKGNFTHEQNKGKHVRFEESSQYEFSAEQSTHGTIKSQNGRGVGHFAEKETVDGKGTRTRSLHRESRCEPEAQRGETRGGIPPSSQKKPRATVHEAEESFVSSEYTESTTERTGFVSQRTESRQKAITKRRATTRSGEDVIGAPEVGSRTVTSHAEHLLQSREVHTVREEGLLAVTISSTVCEIDEHGKTISSSTSSVELSSHSRAAVDSAKWALADGALQFAISTSEGKPSLQQIAEQAGIAAASSMTVSVVQDQLQSSLGGMADKAASGAVASAFALFQGNHKQAARAAAEAAASCAVSAIVEQATDNAVPVSVGRRTSFSRGRISGFSPKIEYSVVKTDGASVPVPCVPGLSVGAGYEREETVYYKDGRRISKKAEGVQKNVRFLSISASLSTQHGREVADPVQRKEGDLVHVDTWEREFSGQHHFRFQAGDRQFMVNILPARQSTTYTSTFTRKADGSPLQYTRDYQAPVSRQPVDEASPSPGTAENSGARFSPPGACEAVHCVSSATAVAEHVDQKAGRVAKDMLDTAMNQAGEETYVWGQEKKSKVTKKHWGISKKSSSQMYDEGTKVKRNTRRTDAQDGNLVTSRVEVNSETTAFRDLRQEEHKKRKLGRRKTEKRTYAPGERRTDLGLVEKRGEITEVQRNADESPLSERTVNKESPNGAKETVRTESDMEHIRKTTTVESVEGGELSAPKVNRSEMRVGSSVERDTFDEVSHTNSAGNLVTTHRTTSRYGSYVDSRENEGEWKRKNSSTALEASHVVERETSGEKGNSLRSETVKDLENGTHVSGDVHFEEYARDRTTEVVSTPEAPKNGSSSSNASRLQHQVKRETVSHGVWSSSQERSRSEKQNVKWRVQDETGKSNKVQVQHQRIEIDQVAGTYSSSVGSVTGAFEGETHEQALARGKEVHMDESSLAENRENITLKCTSETKRVIDEYTGEKGVAISSKELDDSTKRHCYRVQDIEDTTIARPQNGAEAEASSHDENSHPNAKKTTRTRVEQGIEVQITVKQSKTSSVRKGFQVHSETTHVEEHRGYEITSKIDKGAGSSAALSDSRETRAEAHMRVRVTKTEKNAFFVKTTSETRESTRLDPVTGKDSTTTTETLPDRKGFTDGTERALSSAAMGAGNLAVRCMDGGEVTATDLANVGVAAVESYALGTTASVIGAQSSRSASAVAVGVALFSSFATGAARRKLNKEGHGTNRRDTASSMIQDGIEKVGNIAANSLGSKPVKVAGAAAVVISKACSAFRGGQDSSSSCDGNLTDENGTSTSHGEEKQSNSQRLVHKLKKYGSVIADSAAAVAPLVQQRFKRGPGIGVITAAIDVTKEVAGAISDYSTKDRNGIRKVSGEEAVERSVSSAVSIGATALCCGTVVAEMASSTALAVGCVEGGLAVAAAATVLPWVIAPIAGYTALKLVKWGWKNLFGDPKEKKAKEDLNVLVEKYNISDIKKCDLVRFMRKYIRDNKIHPDKGGSHEKFLAVSEDFARIRELCELLQYENVPKAESWWSSLSDLFHGKSLSASFKKLLNRFGFRATQKSSVSDTSGTALVACQ